MTQSMIDADQVVNDIKAGMSDADLRLKHGLTRTTLQTLFVHLASAELDAAPHVTVGRPETQHTAEGATGRPVSAGPVPDDPWSRHIFLTLDVLPVLMVWLVILGY